MIQQKSEVQPSPRDKDLVLISFDRAKMKFRLSGYFVDKNIEGEGQLDNGKMDKMESRIFGSFC